MQRAQSNLRHSAPWAGSNCCRSGCWADRGAFNQSRCSMGLHHPDRSLAGCSQGVSSSRPEEAGTQWLLIPTVFTQNRQPARGVFLRRAPDCGPPPLPTGLTAPSRRLSTPPASLPVRLADGDLWERSPLPSIPVGLPGEPTLAQPVLPGRPGPRGSPSRKQGAAPSPPPDWKGRQGLRAGRGTAV